jgi:hypothetical protein
VYSVGDFKVKYGLLMLGNEKNGNIVNIEYESCSDITQSDILEELMSPFQFSTFPVEYEKYNLNEELYGDRHYALQYISLLQKLKYF